MVLIALGVIFGSLATISKGKPSQIDSKSKLFLSKGNTLVGLHSPAQSDLYRPQEDFNQVLAVRTNEIKQNTRQSIREEITRVAKESPVSGKVLQKVAKCESGYDQSKIGAVGEIGLFQYRRQTWKLFQRKSGKYHLDINSAYDQIKMTVFAFENNLQHHWTCYRKIYGN